MSTKDQRQQSPPSSTPLDLLLNAISGSHHEHPFGETDAQGGNDDKEQDHSIGSLLVASRMLGADGRPRDENAVASGSRSPKPTSSVENSRKRPISPSTPSSSRESKISRILADHLSGAPASRSSSKFTTITVIHGSTGQKSYGKEKRYLLPPPLLRVTGPLYSQLTHVSLAVVPSPANTGSDVSFSDLCNSNTISSSQGFLFPIQPPSPSSVHLPIKHRKTEAKLKKTDPKVTSPLSAIRPRGDLKDGLGFPNLFARAEDLGKAKNFWLRLCIGRPGVEPTSTNDDTPLSDDAARAALETLAGEQGPPDMAAALSQGNYDGGVLGHHTSVFPDTLMSNVTEAAAVSPSTTSPSGEPATPWATFISNPINIVSKPSQRTAKARDVATCLTYGSALSLWVRINSQNARTKFMHVQEAKQLGDVDEKGEETADGDGIAGGGGRPVLTARTAKWSAFRLDCVRRSVAHGNEPVGPTTAGSAQGTLVTYGSIVVLTDLITGITSEPLRITKVDKLHALKDDIGPVSELQKVAFAKVDHDGIAVAGDRPGDWYLSAPSAMVEVIDPSKARMRKDRMGSHTQNVQVSDEWEGGRPSALHDVEEPETTITEDLPVVGINYRAIPKNKGKGSSGNGKGKARGKPLVPKTKRNAISLATAAEDRDVSGRTAGLTWAPGKEREVLMNVSVPLDEARRDGQQRRERTHDVMQKAIADEVEDWMVWTIGSVSHFTYTFFDGLNGADQLPTNPITPCPMLLEEPVLHLEPSVETQTITLTVTHFHVDGDTPFEVYLGPLGPLRAYAFQSTAPRDKDPYSNGARSMYRAVSMDGPEVEVPLVYSSYPAALPHVVVSVDLPPLPVILKAMRDCGLTVGGVHNQAGERRTANVSAPDLGFKSTNNWNEAEQQQMVLQDALENVSPTVRAEPMQFAPSTDPLSLDGVFSGQADHSYPGDADFPPAGDLRGEGAVHDSSHSVNHITGSSGHVTSGLGSELPLLMMPAESSTRGDLAALPLLFVRTGDGVGYSLGKQVTASTVKDRGEYDLSSAVADETGNMWELSVI